MNRRLHSLPFAALRDMVSYKAAWNGIPSDDVDPEYTSQQCPRTECQHTSRSNRCDILSAVNGGASHKRRLAGLGDLRSNIPEGMLAVPRYRYPYPPS